MRSRCFVSILLAVLSNIVTAGLVRRNGELFRPGFHVRSFNQSIVNAVSLQPQPPSTTPSPTSSSSSSLTPTITPNLKAGSAAVTTPIPSKQVGKVPAVGNGPGAATINTEDFSGETPTTTKTPSQGASASTQSAGSNISGNNEVPSASASKQSGKVPAFGSGPGAASVASNPTLDRPAPTSSKRIQLGTGASSQAATKTQEAQPSAFPTERPSDQKTSIISLRTQDPTSTPLPISISSASGEALASSTFANPSASASPTTASKPSEAPAAVGGNFALAAAFNSRFGSLKPDSPCNINDEQQAHACINGLFAQCNSVGRYTMTSCPEGQQCFALPLPASSTGVSVQCDTPSDAKKKLQPQVSAGAGESSAGNSAAKSSTQNPAASNSATTSPAAPSPAAPSPAATSPAAPSPAASRPAASVSGPAASAPAASSVAPNIVPTSSVVQPEPQGQATSIINTDTSTTKLEPTTFTTRTRSNASPDVATAASQPAPVPESPKPSLEQPAATTTDAPLILSFPPTSSSQKPTIAPAVPSRAPVAQSQNSAPVPAAESTPPAASPTAPAVNPSTPAAKTSASSPNITIVPLGNERLVTVTETVTTTTTARP
ncbi:MAG: hypothetical protein LQ342_002216 [Letrouitia transgressa]|nr:MAG: hypothetical protein LQ342_002216 [Letrouitia transgressa]